MYFSAVFGFPALLINPVTNPSFHMRKHLGTQTNLKTGDLFEWKQEYLDTLKNMEQTIQNTPMVYDRLFIAVGEKDLSVDPEQVRHFFPKQVRLRTYPDDHRFLTWFPKILLEKEALEIADLFKRKKASLHSISEKLDTHSAIGEFFFTLMAALAQLERKQIGERTATALAHKKSLGEKTGGDVPFGSNHIDGKLADNGEEINAINLMHRLRHKGYSLRKICSELKEKNIRTKSNKVVWQPQVVSRILKRASSL